MPIFEYRCEACGCEFELLVRGGDFEAVCPICNSRLLQKRFSVFGMKSASSSAVVEATSSCGGCAGHNCSGCHH